jgi:hypothetical protein
LTDTTTPAPAPVLATIARHGAPPRAIWHGVAERPPEPEGVPCTIRRADDRWMIQCEGSQPWLIGPRTRVWLALIPEVEPPAPDPAALVRNPWSVVLKLDRPTFGAYRHLSEVLNLAALTANDAGAMAAGEGHDVLAADLRAVRDSLRAAAQSALLGRLSKNPTPCRRCGAACTNCTPPPVPA